MQETIKQRKAIKERLGKENGLMKALDNRSLEYRKNLKNQKFVNNVE
jgi:hypothetical protein